MAKPKPSQSPKQGTKSPGKASRTSSATAKTTGAKESGKPAKAVASKSSASPKPGSSAKSASGAAAKSNAKGAIAKPIGAKTAVPKTPATKSPAMKAQPKSSTKLTSKPSVNKPESKVAGKSTSGASTAGGKPISAKPSAGKPAEAKSGRKGITVVTPKPAKKARIKPRVPTISTPLAALVASKHGAGKPLIPSGPNASAAQPLGFHGGGGVEAHKVEGKTPFGKRDLARYRAMLIQKRAELVGDVSSMESEALKGESGSLSSLPQHIAEQGSETYDQTLSLDLAAADRKLIKEIDDALIRIEKGTYGICELTGRPIKVERLEELPWARYSIEAARDLERRHMRI